MLRRALLVAVLLCSLGTAAAASATPTAPRNVFVHPMLGGARVSWTDQGATGVTYTAAAEPAGTTCSVVDGASCTLAISTLGPEHITVTATSGAGSATSSVITMSVRPVVVVAGQSNALGICSYGIDPSTGANVFGPAQLTDADRLDSMELWRFGPVEHFSSGFGSLDRPQVMQTKAGVRAIFGPEIGLARTLMTDRHLALTIVKVAYPGSRIAQWLPAAHGGLNSVLAQQISAAATTIARMGEIPVIAGIVWFQGESDVQVPADAASYGANLATLVAGWRVTYGALVSVVLIQESSAAFLALGPAPGICAASTCGAMKAGDAEVRVADAAFAATTPKVAVVDSADLARIDAATHLTNAAELTIGQRAAQALEPLLEGVR